VRALPFDSSGFYHLIVIVDERGGGGRACGLSSCREHSLRGYVKIELPAGEREGKKGRRGGVVLLFLACTAQAKSPLLTRSRRREKGGGGRGGNPISSL